MSSSGLTCRGASGNTGEASRIAPLLLPPPTVFSKLLQIYPCGAMGMSHFLPLNLQAFLSESNWRPNSGQNMEGTALVGLALLVTKTSTSCCPRVYREDHGSCGLEKNEKRVAKKSQLQSQCHSADCFPGVKYSPGVREGKGDWGHLGRLLCVNYSSGRKLNILYVEENSPSLTPWDRNIEYWGTEVGKKWEDLGFGMRGSGLGSNSFHLLVWNLGKLI